MTESHTIAITVKFFATLKDLAGTNHLSLQLPTTSTIDDVRQQLIAQFPALHDALPHALAAVNQEYVFPGHPIANHDEVAFFPPVSGGSQGPEIFLLAEQPIDLNNLTAQIVIPATGAVALFSGYVRGKTSKDGATINTLRLEYEAYAPMAEAKMRQVAAEIREQWPLVQGIAIVQRIGTLNVGEPTILIACSSGHRDQGCFEAARYGIDRLKEIVPIWKKEISADSSQWVEGNYQPTLDDISPNSTK